ncbi:hypothetical protein C3L33_17771, partial [Rhododendron williamsianum]
FTGSGFQSCWNSHIRRWISSVALSLLMEHNLTIKTYMAIMAERDAAIREKHMALDERRRAFAERDMAMLQRDAAEGEAIKGDHHQRNFNKTPSKSQRKGKRQVEDSSPEVNCWKLESDFASEDDGGEELDDELEAWKESLGLNQINFDENTMPAPVCSCTGLPQPCYKWGNGGWHRLAARPPSEGQDLSIPLDLKDHWSKHGSNRYSALK